MPIATMLQLLPVLLEAISPLLSQLSGAHADDDLTAARQITVNLAHAYNLALQAGRLVAKCQAENRDPTPDEMQPFESAWRAAQARLAADLQAP